MTDAERIAELEAEVEDLKVRLKECRNAALDAADLPAHYRRRYERLRQAIDRVVEDQVAEEP